MKMTRIALLAAAGIVALALPASAATSTVTEGTDVRAAKSSLIQVAQNASRAANEARGGNFKSKKKKKAKTKM